MHHHRPKGCNDDGESSLNLETVLKIFEQSPVTSGKASVADVVTARLLLRSYTVEEIEFGILLGGARKATSLFNAEMMSGDRMGASGAASGKIQSLAYFEGPISEAAQMEGRRNEEYKRYLWQVLKRLTPKKEPVGVSA